MLRDERGHGGGRPDTTRNVLGDRLEVCSTNPMTGFFRDGCCDTGREDIGSHTVCAVMTAAFLEFSKSSGNDLSTPIREFGARVRSPLTAASATFALKAGVWFRRARLVIVSPDSRVNLARRQAETPLIVLCRFPEPAQCSLT